MLGFGKNYEAWKIDKTDFPEGADLESKIKFLLNYAITAPSALNSQPWNFRIQGNKLKILPDFSRSLSNIADKNNRLLYISIGCVTKNFELAARAFGFYTNANLIKKPESTLVEVEVEQGKTDKNSIVLLDSILSRTTNRNPYLPKDIPKDILKKLTNINKEQNLKVFITKEPMIKGKIINLTRKVDLVIWNKLEFKSHHLPWIRHNLTTAKDGMPGFTVGVPFILSFFGRLIIKNPNFAKIQARKNNYILSKTPYFGFILSEKHNQETWIRVGQIYEYISLLAEQEGIAVAPMAEITEIKNFYKDTMKILNTKLRPQIFFRLGYSTKPAKHSPRRKVEDFLLT